MTEKHQSNDACIDRTDSSMMGSVLEFVSTISILRLVQI